MPEGESTQVANGQAPVQANTPSTPALNGVKTEPNGAKPAQTTQTKPAANQPAEAKPGPNNAQNQKASQKPMQNNRPNPNQNGHNGHNKNQPIKRFNPVNPPKTQPEPVQSEKKFTGRCRLFVGNLPGDITEKEFRDLFSRYGELGEIFLNNQRSFGFVKLDTRINAEHAKQELDGYTFKGRCIRVRFASHGAAVRVKNLSQHVSNEYLEQAFSMFGRVERAVVIVDDKGRSIGEGIVEFERKPSATQCINKCAENCFILTSYPKPVIVEPLEQKDDEDGLPEKSIIKNQQFYAEREVAPHFAPNNSFELKMALKWRDLYELEKQIKEEGLKKIQEAREQLEHETEFTLIDYKEQKIKEDLRAKQEELQRIEDMRKHEFQRRKEMDNGFRRDNMMNQGPNQRMQHGNGQNFDQSMMNQNMPAMMQNGQGRRFDQSHNFNQNLNQMPPQQQAMLAAQLSAFAMAANMSGMNGPMYEQGMPMQNQARNERGGRNFNRRGGAGGNNRASQREDPSPYPGFDSKRARY